MQVSQFAEAVGVGRATLYKYFPDVEAILHAWHEREIEAHLSQLGELRDRPGTPGQRLATVFQAFAAIAQESRGHRDTELASILHRDHEMLRPEAHLRALVTDLLTAAAATGDVREDIAPDELASYCLHALSAARTLRSKRIAAMRQEHPGRWTDDLAVPPLSIGGRPVLDGPHHHLP